MMKRAENLHEQIKSRMMMKSKRILRDKDGQRYCKPLFCILCDRIKTKPDLQESMYLGKLSSDHQEHLFTACERVSNTPCCTGRNRTLDYAPRRRAIDEADGGNILIAAFVSGMLAVFGGVIVARFLQRKFLRRAFSVVSITAASNFEKTKEEKTKTADENEGNKKLPTITEASL